MPQLAQLVQLGQSVGLPLQQAKLMAAIGMAESGGNAIAHNPNRSTGDNSYGIWQINMIDTLGPARRKEFGLKNNEQLFDPNTNAMAMKRVLQGSGPHAWTTYTSGKYKQFLPAIDKAVAGGVPSGPFPSTGFESSQTLPPQPQQQSVTVQPKITPEQFLINKVLENALSSSATPMPWNQGQSDITQQLSAASTPTTDPFNLNNLRAFGIRAPIMPSFAAQ